MSALRLLSALLFSLLLIACETEADKNGGLGGGGNGYDKVSDVTDYSMCSGVTPSNLTLRSNTWITEEILKVNGGRLTIFSELKFLGTTLKSSAECHLFDSTGKLISHAKAEVQPIADFVTNIITIPNGMSDSKPLQLGNGQVFNCQTEVPAGRYRYEFKGRCLAIDDNGNWIRYAPN